MRTLLFCVLVAVGLVLFTRPAAAADKPVQVLNIASPDAYQNAKALTGALRRGILRAKGWTVGPGEFSLEVLTAALDCPEIPDQECLAKIGAKVEAEAFVWGYVKKSGEDQVEAHIHLWQKDGAPKETKLQYSVNLNDDTDDALLAEAEKALSALLGAPMGTLIISAGTVNGELLIDGMLVGLVRNGKAKVDVPAGKSTVMVEAEGYENLLGTVIVPAGGTTTVTLDPVPIEDAGLDEDDEDDAAEDRPMTDQELYGYIAIGAGGAAVLTGAAFWIHSWAQTTDSEFETFVNETPRDQDPCNRARIEGESDIISICDSNVTSRTLAYVFVPLGLVLGGVGTYLVLSEDGEDAGSEEEMAKTRDRVRVQPLVGFGPGYGQLDVRVTF